MKRHQKKTRSPKRFKSPSEGQPGNTVHTCVDDKRDGADAERDERDADTERDLVAAHAECGARRRVGDCAELAGMDTGVDDGAELADAGGRGGRGGRGRGFGGRGRGCGRGCWCGCGCGCGRGCSDERGAGGVVEEAAEAREEPGVVGAVKKQEAGAGADGRGEGAGAGAGQRGAPGAGAGGARAERGAAGGACVVRVCSSRV